MHVRFRRVMKTWAGGQSSPTGNHVPRSGDPTRVDGEEGEFWWSHTRSKAVEHALGCVATKIGFDDMVDWLEGSTDISRFARLLLVFIAGCCCCCW